VAKYVKKVVIRPWFITPPRITANIWTNIHEILDPEYIRNETSQRLQRFLWEDFSLIVTALNAMENINEYFIEWNEEKDYHPELYKACFAPLSQKWIGQLTKLTIKVPPQVLKSLASIRLKNLETFEYHFCTGQMSPRDIDDIYNGFLVFVNNLKDSLQYISFISTHTSLNLDITRIYKLLGPFPKLRSISLSAPFDGAHLSDPSVFVQFLDKHRSTLKDISVLTSRCTVHSRPSDPDSINWIQNILTLVDSPFPRLRSLTLAMRPLKTPSTNVSDFLEMHISTLDSLILADRALDYCGLERLFKTASGPLDLEGLRHFRVKLTNLSPRILYYLASKMPGLVSLDIECSSIVNCHSYEDFVSFFFFFFFSFFWFCFFFLFVFFLMIGRILQCNHCQ
jgi:hypothetical protein